MKKKFKKFLAIFWGPTSTISDNPWKFSIWITVAVMFGLSGFWIPLLIAFFSPSIHGTEIYENLLKTAPFSVFSIVLIADAFSNAVIVKDSSSNPHAAGIRGLSLILALLLIILQAIILTLSSTGTIISQTLHYSLLILALFLGIYVYCLRDPSWEKSVDTLIKKENADVKSIAINAKTISSDESGVKL